AQSRPTGTPRRHPVLLQHRVQLVLTDQGNRQHHRPEVPAAQVGGSRQERCPDEGGEDTLGEVRQRLRGAVGRARCYDSASSSSSSGSESRIFSMPLSSITSSSFGRASSAFCRAERAASFSSSSEKGALASRLRAS